MLKNKNALVTGSTSGIGLGIARELASKGANIVLNGFGMKSEIENLRTNIESDFSVKAIYLNADLSKANEIESFFNSAESKLGTIDILVNNAGIQHTDSIETFPVEKWDLIIALNLSAVFHLSRLALPAMKEKNWGRIINIASVHGMVASTQKAAYVAAKHGVIGLSKVIALECAETQITCNAICPGWVLTPLVEKQIAALAQEKKLSLKEASDLLLSEKQPSKRFTGISELAELASFLCSNAAANITGASLPVDGGWTAR
ncbi:MAG: 3-hydroxybutyrate dehydrogenase [Candidatus Obscuribacterales bacterium]|nr:3-hydroxybutyrate dehydrogenase [Candidatus Obscuribacterales bacterium]